MEKNKLSLFLGIVLLLSLIGFISAATGTVTLIVPTDGGTVVGSFIMNVTNVTFSTMRNCTFTIGSVSTANTSVTIGTVVNNSLINVNTTFDSTLVEDSNNYILTASCRNTTNDIATDTATITVDNTIPQAPSSLSPTTGTIDTDGTINFSATVTGENTTGCTLYFSGTNPGASSYTMTHSGSTCSHQLTSIPEQTYTWYIRGSDSTNTTDSDSKSVQVSVNSGSGTTTGDGSIAETTVKGIPIWLIVLVIVGIVVYLIYKK